MQFKLSSSMILFVLKLINLTNKKKGKALFWVKQLYHKLYHKKKIVFNNYFFYIKKIINFFKKFYNNQIVFNTFINLNEKKIINKVHLNYSLLNKVFESQSMYSKLKIYNKLKLKNKKRLGIKKWKSILKSKQKVKKRL